MNSLRLGGASGVPGLRKSCLHLCLSRFSSAGDEVIRDRNVHIFDRALKAKQRNRVAWLMDDDDPVLSLVTDNLLDRLDDCTRKFPNALNLGGAFEHVRRLLRGRGGIETLTSMDTSPDMVRRSMDTLAAEIKAGAGHSSFLNVHLVGDEEQLPFKEGSLDLIISSLGMHWVNDLPGAIIQCRRALKPDGFFLASMFGGETLRELRIACTCAQLEREGGVSPRISPLAQVRDAGNLLTRAGLALPAVDVDTFTVRYPSVLELIEHLRSMGEINAISQRHKVLRKDTAVAAAAIYETMFGEEDGSVPATFQVIYLAGWRPHPLQQTAKRRGSATASFGDIQSALEKVDGQVVYKNDLPNQGSVAAGDTVKKGDHENTVHLPSGGW